MRAALLLTLCVAGCAAPDSAPHDLMQGDAGDLAVGRLVLGGADAVDGGSLTLVDGQDAPLIEGAQGGFHVWMKYRIENARLGEYQMSRYAHKVSDGKIVLRGLPNTITVDHVDERGGWESPTAIPMFMCPSPTNISIIDTLIRYEIDVADDRGNPIARGQVDMTPRCPLLPSETHDFCQKICTG